MPSKTGLLKLVQTFDWKGVDEGLRASPALLRFRDERGRGWLHLCCASNPAARRLNPRDSVKTADVLLALGLPIDGEAFREGAWRATPLWFAIGRGRNLLLAEHLLKRGCTPNYCLWAASFNRDLDAIRLLVRHGADVNDRSVVDESPLLGAVKWSHFDAAEQLLRLGANVDFQDAKGMTALHYMLKKSSDKQHFRMLIAHGARGDLADAKGETAAEMMRRKRDPEFRRLAGRLLSA